MRSVFKFIALFCICGAPLFAALPDVDTLRTGFAQLDLDKDGRVTPKEWDQHAFALFNAADLNKNNRLDAHEVNLDTDAEAENTFVRADANQDGQLSVDEFMQLRRALFKVADINGGGFINPVEYTLFRLLSVSGWTDTNHNGRINFPELRGSLAMLQSAADTDGDGELSATEANFLTPEEYAAATAKGPLDANGLYRLYVHYLTGE